MRIAIIGCGFVADLYMATLRSHPSLQVVAACDRVPAHAQRFHAHWKTPVFTVAQQMVEQCAFDLALNLTNPGSHYEVTRMLLQAGKHVYSEKPLAMNMEQALELAELAQAQGLGLASAPCNHLAEAAQASARALRQGIIGTPRLAYAEMDDGLLAEMPYRDWKGISGAPWPYKDEFEVGCTLEHAGYCLTWLLLFFGPVERIVSFHSLQRPGKPVDGREASDFSVAMLEFKSGVAARLTCSIVAAHDHSMRIIGDKGILHLEDCWFYRTPARIRHYLRIRKRFFLTPWSKRLPQPATGPDTARIGAASMDFARGPREMALAIEQNRRSRIPLDFCLHVNEIALAIHHATINNASSRIYTSFVPLELVDSPII